MMADCQEIGYQLANACRTRVTCQAAERRSQIRMNPGCSDQPSVAFVWLSHGEDHAVYRVSDTAQHADVSEVSLDQASDWRAENNVNLLRALATLFGVSPPTSPVTAVTRRS
jgi:hypothetical protein